MTLLLEQGTKPKGLPLKTHGDWDNNVVHLGDYEISLKDFTSIRWCMMKKHFGIISNFSEQTALPWAATSLFRLATSNTDVL